MAANIQRMNARSRAALQLVSFASDKCCRSLSHAVQEMRYGVEIVAGHIWLGEDYSVAGRMIVLIEQPGAEKKRILEALNRVGGSQLLAVANSSPLDWDPQIVRYFQDVLCWPCSPRELEYRIDRLFAAAVDGEGEGGNESLVEHLESLGLIGRSGVFLSAMRELLEFAPRDVPILVFGETGTGKELAARAVHKTSDRLDGPFVPVNCGAIPDNLVESELFGHERGAFTDARESRRGLVAQADGGTLFLDEIDTLSPMAQIALLRFLETQEYRPIGASRLKIANVRIVAATNADLYELVKAGRFRRDLLYRLDVCGVRLPPLHERDSDVELLSRFFLRRYADKYGQPTKTLHPCMLEWMLEAPWTGNVRELDNFLHRQVLLSQSAQVFAPMPMPGQAAGSNQSARGIPWRKKTYKEAKNEALDAFERSYLTWLMSESSGNLSLAARKTSLQRSSLRRLLQKHDIDKNVWKQPLG